MNSIVELELNGVKCYGIFNNEIQMFWIYAYTNSTVVREVANKVVPGDALDIENNWRKNRKYLVLSRRDVFP